MPPESATSSKKNPQAPNPARPSPLQQLKRRESFERDRSARTDRDAPALLFSALAYLKLQYVCHRGDTEIGAFAITSKERPLYIQDIVTVQQTCSAASVEFDDTAVAEFFDEQVDAGRSPEQFARIWVHTHPGDCPNPSGTDEETFRRVFGRCSWAVMFILARGGATYCRLRVSTGPPGDGCGAMSLSAAIPVEVDLSNFAAAMRKADTQAWDSEYGRNIVIEEQVLAAQAPWWHEDQRSLSADEHLLDEYSITEEAFAALREVDEEPWMHLDEVHAAKSREVADAE